MGSPVCTVNGSAPENCLLVPYGGGIWLRRRIGLRQGQAEEERGVDTTCWRASAALRKKANIASGGHNGIVAYASPPPKLRRTHAPLTAELGGAAREQGSATGERVWDGRDVIATAAPPYSPRAWFGAAPTRQGATHHQAAVSCRRVDLQSVADKRLTGASGRRGLDDFGCRRYLTSRSSTMATWIRNRNAWLSS